MRVTCKSVGEFIGNLKAEKDIYRNIVYITIDEEPVNEVKFAVIIQATAIIRTEDGGEYLLVVSENCGVDYRDKSQDYAGSEVAFNLKDKLAMECGELGLEVRTGLVSE